MLLVETRPRAAWSLHVVQAAIGQKLGRAELVSVPPVTC